MLTISINLSKLPKEKISVAKNGDEYINLMVGELRETDPYGNTHSVWVNQTKEEREAKKERIYCGRGKKL